jgi:hypothetical protein
MATIGLATPGAFSFSPVGNEKRAYLTSLAADGDFTTIEIHDTDLGWVSGAIVGSPVTITARPRLYVGYHFSGVDKFRLHIWDDNGSNAPGALLASTAEITVATPTLTYNDPGSGTNQWIDADTYSDGTAAPFTADSSTQHIIALRANYTPTSSGPSNTEQPQLTGTPVQGETLTARDGTWTGSPSFTRKWQRATTAGGTYSDIAGATGATYVLQSDDVGKFVRVLVTATEGANSTDAASNVTYEAVLSPAPAVTSDEVGFSVGGNFFGRSEAQQELELDDMATLAPGGYIRFELNWSAVETSKGTFNWTTYDRLIADVEQRGFKLLLGILFAPTWAKTGTALYPTNNSDLADFAAAAVNRYKPGGTQGRNVRAWEVWNEPNIRPFWDPTVGLGADATARAASRAKYSGMLSAAYDAIKAADPNATVLTAGFAPFGEYTSATADGINPKAYFEAMVETDGVGGKFDAVAVHTYVSTDVQDYDVSIYSGWSDLEDNTVSYRSIMEDNSLGAKPIWVTEHGLPIGQTGTKYPGGVTQQAQADFVTEGYRRWAAFTWPKGPLIYFSHRPETSATGAYQYGIVEATPASPLSNRRAWYAMRDFARDSLESESGVGLFFGAAFGYNPYDTDPVYVDLSDRLLSWSFQRGRRTVTDAIDPARLTAHLYNGDRALDPSYLSSPYAGDVEPGVRVVLDIDGRRVYSGFVEGWPQDWDGRLNTVTITALDLFDTFNVDMIPATVYGVQKTGARITAGLSEIGVPSAWYAGVNTGIDDAQSHTAGEEDNWLEHFKKVAVTEQGYLFQDRTGLVKFYQRHALSLSPFTDIQVTVSNDPAFGEWPLSDVDDPDYSVKDIRNDVRVTREGGATTRVVDSASVTKYRKRTYQVTTIHDSTTVPADLATWILQRDAYPKLRPDGVTLEPQMEPGMLHPIIERDLADRVRLRVQPPGPAGVIDLEAAIQSIEMSMGEDRKLVVKWNIAPPTGASQVWKLGTSTLGVDTYLGF